MKYLVLVFIIIFSLFFKVSFGQTSNSTLIGTRTIKILDIEKYILKNFIVINALDTASGKELIILSQRDQKINCDSSQTLSRLTPNEYYDININIHPLVPFNLCDDSLRVIFDSKPIRLNLDGMIFTRKNLPYYSEQIFQDMLCE